MSNNVILGNSTFDHTNPAPLDKNMISQKKTPVFFKKNRSYRVLNRNYIKPRNAGSENRNMNRSQNNRAAIQNVVAVDALNRSNESLKISRN